MEANEVSVYSTLVMEGLKKDLGGSYVKKIDGCIDRNGDNVLDDKDRDGVVQTDEAWEYFFNNYCKGKYASIMAELKKEGFEYPFDLVGNDEKDKSLIEWVDKTKARIGEMRIGDEAGKAKEAYQRLQDERYGGNSENEGGLDIRFDDSKDVIDRPTGEKLPFEVFSS